MVSMVFENHINRTTENPPSDSFGLNSPKPHLESIIVALDMVKAFDLVIYSNLIYRFLKFDLHFSSITTNVDTHT